MSSIRQYPRHPATVEFGEMECCALRHAMARPEHTEFISGFKERTGLAEPRHIRALLEETFEKTARLVFIPWRLHRTFYLALAMRERNFLESPGAGSLKCGHRKSDHLESLKKIVFLMSQPQGGN